VLIGIEAQLCRRPKFAKFSNLIFSAEASDIPPTTSPSLAEHRITQFNNRPICESAQKAADVVAEFEEKGALTFDPLSGNNFLLDASDGVTDATNFLQRALFGVVGPTMTDGIARPPLLLVSTRRALPESGPRAEDIEGGFGTNVTSPGDVGPTATSMVE
jgi:hypothetical protein